MNKHLGKQRNLANITSKFETILELVQKFEAVWHKIFMDNDFSSSELFNDQHHTKINACAT
jgi:hypothetical protein